MNIQSLWPGHPIRTMFAEHEVLLRVLEKLQTFTTNMGQIESVDADVLSELAAFAQTLLDAEPHHQREEQVLFPALEEIGIEGPPQVMRMEHEEFRAKKRELQDLAQRGGDLPVEVLKEQVHRVASYLVHALTEHIHKENQILYPMALEHIEPNDWEQMTADCNAIGPCSFTPQD